jgi:hypothetical protein
MKTCTSCGVAKAGDEFYLRDINSRKLRSRCKQCYYKERRTREARNGYVEHLKSPEVRSKVNTDHRLAYRRKKLRNPALMLWRGAKNRASKKGLPFNIEVSDVEIPSVCPVLGIPIGVLYSTHNRAQTATIDRVVPHLGYVKGNIRVISFRANMLKCDATADEIEAVLNYVRKHAA